MRKVYRILGVNIALETEFDFTTEENLKPFEIDSNSSADETYHYQLCEKTPGFSAQKLSDDRIFKAYQDGEKTYYEHYTSDDMPPFLLMISDKNNPGYTECYYVKPEKTKNFLSGTLFMHIPLEQILAKRKAFILHSSAIDMNGQCVVFTAPSGTGKTTHANLWVEHEGAEILNGDRTGIRCIDGKWIASGLPYDGSSRKFNPKMIPLKAIVVIRQGKENVIEPLRPAEAFRWILSETAIYYWEKESADIVLEAIRNLVTEVPCYILHCRPDKEAVDTVKKALFK